ncbi:hypothetical protein [Nonlabens dokdonensis]|uniref:Uncharacterized protein n=2 Tax=Nonlabens dokdonensis TaxID=328515 RepID=L7WC59_NONDD|nr:hypothetical protein [Nonlabens dokdonensis]AGC77511.1 hypothetical protein DDD_2384 [Nonlabens dokdonensis DSW-6]
METIELRNLIAQYTNHADEKLLKIIKSVYEAYQKNEEDFYDELPTEVQDLLQLSHKQIKSGDLTSHKEVMNKHRTNYSA